MGKAARKLSGSALAEWRAKHPFDPETGRFVKGGGSSAAPPAPAAPAAGRARARLGGDTSAPVPAPVKAGRARAALSTANRSEGNDLAAMSNVLSNLWHKDLHRRIMALENDSDGTVQAEGMLSGLTVPALKEFTATLPPTVSRKGKTKAQLISNIVEGTIGFRQRAEAIGPGIAAARTAERLQPPSPSDPVSNLPRAARAKIAKPKARPEGERARDLIAISGGVNPWADRQVQAQAQGRAAAALRPTPAINEPTTRRLSSNPRKRNTWGGAPQPNGVHYHPDGLIGMTVDSLGTDAQVEVRGDSLANELDRIATSTVLGHMTAQHQADDLKRLATELPDGPGKRAVQSAADDLDAPRIGIDRWASGVEPVLARFPVLRQLAQRLEAVPVARGADILGDRADTRELDRLNKALAEFGAGSLGGGRFISAVEAVGNMRHESREGKFEIDRAVRDAVDQLQSMQRADRTLFYPPGKA